MIKWHKYPQEKPNSYRMYWCKLDNGEPKKMSYDSVYGWCCDFDEADRPHFIYDWYLEWAEIDTKNEKEWEKEQDSYFKKVNSFIYDDDWEDCSGDDDDDYWG